MRAQPNQRSRLRLLTAEQIEADQGDELTDRATLPEFFALWFEPNYCRRHQLAAATVDQYRRAVELWRRLTVDPPLAAIDKPLAEQFMADLAEAVQHPATQRKHAAALNRIFARAAGGPFDHAAQLLEHAPRLPLPRRAAAEVRRDFRPAEVLQLLEAAQQMNTPSLPGCPPPAAWWQALIGLAWLQGFRLGTLLALEWSHYDQAGQLWRIPAHAMKGRRAIVRQVHPQAGQLLAAIAEPDRQLLLPWYGSPSSRRFLHRQIERIVRLAGLPDSPDCRTHALRRGHASQVAAISPDAARLSLGHSLFSTTASHYIAAGVAGQAVARLTIPTKEDADQ